MCALIVAGGRGSRARAEKTNATPKQYVEIAGQTVLARTIGAFIGHDDVDLVQVVIHKDDESAYRDAVAGGSFDAGARLLEPVFGGEDRQASVRAGLEALVEDSPEVVLIHDAARPFVEAQTIAAVAAEAVAVGGAICGVPVADTLKRAGGGGGEGDQLLISKTVSRAQLWRAQTPQGFSFPAILGAHRLAALDPSIDFTDDASVAEKAGMKVALVMGSGGNEKLTTAEDIEMASQRLSASRALNVGYEFETRVGSGYDVHRFCDGSHVWLCGVRVAHDKALEGHSDADVGLHALTDAILGALGDGDIGTHFPPSDPQWKGARSDIFLRDAVARVGARGGALVNVDVTLICEEPKIGQHRGEMRAAMAAILEIEIDRVSIKATTSERLGFTGRGEGIAGMASVSIRLPCPSRQY